jgi:hypothetical protein
MLKSECPANLLVNNEKQHFFSNHHQKIIEK